MKINPYIQVQQMYSSQKTGTARKTGTVGPKDGVVISNIGKEIQTAKQALANTSDIRTDIVEPIRTAVNNGTYEVSGEKFADKLVAAVAKM